MDFTAIRLLGVLTATLCATVLQKPVCASALAAWGIGISVSSNLQTSGTLGGFGVHASALDGYDARDRELAPGPKVYFGAFHQEGHQGWAGPSGFYDVDVREPLFGYGESHTWRIYVWADPTLPPQATSFGIIFNYDTPPLGPFGRDLGLKLSVIQVPQNSGCCLQPGMVFGLPPFGGMADLPVYRTDNGLDGYVFDLTATVVPEPSSLLALSAGLAGMAGALRRRAGAG